RDRELRSVRDLGLRADRLLRDVRDHDLVDAADRGVAVEQADRVEQLVLDRLLVVPAELGLDLAGELGIDEYREGAGVGLAIVRLDRFTVVRVRICTSWYRQSSGGKNRGEALHGDPALSKHGAVRCTA